MKKFAEILTRIVLGTTLFLGIDRALSSEPLPSSAVTEDYAAALSALKVKTATLFHLEEKSFALLPGNRILLVSSDYKQVKGFRGPSVLAVLLDKKGSVAKVAIVKSPDTRAYVRRVRRKLRQLTGQHISKLKRPVLAVSGATITSKAVNATLDSSLDAFQPIFAKLTFTGKQLFYDGKAISPGLKILPAR